MHSRSHTNARAHTNKIVVQIDSGTSLDYFLFVFGWMQPFLPLGCHYNNENKCGQSISIHSGIQCTNCSMRNTTLHFYEKWTIWTCWLTFRMHIYFLFFFSDKSFYNVLVNRNSLQRRKLCILTYIRRLLKKSSPTHKLLECWISRKSIGIPKANFCWKKKKTCKWDVSVV